MFTQFLLVPLLSLFPFLSPGPTGEPVPQLKSIDKEVSAFMHRWEIPGASVALVKNGRLVYARGFGQADSDLPAQPYHLFRIASLSKPITAIAIMKLVESGQLQLSQKVFGPEGILPDSVYGQPVDKRAEAITIEHLLQHTAGWNRHSNPQGDPMFNSVFISQAMAAPASPETIIRYMLAQPLDFKPGTRYAYSNIGYSILGRIIEHVTGLPYEEYVQTTILQPIGIFNMRLARNRYEDKIAEEVRYYDERTNGLVPSFTSLQHLVPWQYGGFNIEAMDAHGGWLATATDLAKLLTAIDGLQNKPDILSIAMLQRMTIPSPAFRNYAMGWMVNGNGSIWHTGSLPGSSAVLASLPDGLSWVILFNGRQDSDAYFNALDRLMWRALRHVKTWPTHDFFEPLKLADQPRSAPVLPASATGVTAEGVN